MRLSLLYVTFFSLLTSCTLANNESQNKGVNISSIEPLTQSIHSDIPASPQEGDSQNITQTRGNVRTTYRQVYQADRWVTKSVKKQIIEQIDNQIVISKV